MTGALALLLIAPLHSAGDEHAWDHPSEIETDRVPAFTTGGSCLIRGATIHTAVGPAFEGDVLVEDGKITAVGTGLENPGVHEIDGTIKPLIQPRDEIPDGTCLELEHLAGRIARFHEFLVRASIATMPFKTRSTLSR